MTYLRKVLALAQTGVSTHDVNEPLSDSDTSQENPLLQEPTVSGPVQFSDCAQKELDSMTPLNKLKIHSFLTSAESAVSDGRPVQASEQYIRAATGAKIAGAHKACQEIWRWVQSLAQSGNSTPKESAGGDVNKETLPNPALSRVIAASRQDG